MDETCNTDVEITRIPEPREGLWYGQVLLANKVIHTLISDSMKLQPERLVKFMTSSLPIEIVEALEPNQEFWLDLATARELHATCLDLRFFGIIPPTNITAEQN